MTGDPGPGPRGVDGPGSSGGSEGPGRADRTDPADRSPEPRLSAPHQRELAPGSSGPGGEVADPAEPAFLPWFTALVPRLGTVVRSHLPGAPLDARRRELLAAVVAAAAGAEPLTRVHAGWLHLLGPAELTELDDDVLAWAAAEVAVEPRLDEATLPAEVTPAVRAAVAALVAQGVVAAATWRHAGSALDRVRGRRPRSVGGLAADLAACAAGLPITAPVVLAGAALGAVGRVLPPPVPVDTDAEPNLLAQLLAEALPTWLGSPVGRTLVAGLPVEVPVAVRSGLTGATVRLGRGRVRVANGVDEDAWALFDGEVDSLLRAGSHTLTRELRATPPGP